jgi:DNA-directed RNA polymerase subunit RPC12/RpoP
MTQCTHPGDRQRVISDVDVQRGRREFVQEDVVCDACGQHRRIRTELHDDSPESGIWKRCPDCGERVFTTARDGKLGPHNCPVHG